jgi:hypothetical protein
MMYAILMLFLITFAIALERAFALYIAVREDKHALLTGIQKHILKGDIQGAIRFVSGQRQGPLARIIKAGLLKVNMTDKEVQAALDEASLREFPTSRSARATSRCSRTRPPSSVSSAPSSA